MAISIHSASSVLAFGLVACIASQPAPAATASASFGVSATVQASCGVSFRPDPAATTGRAAEAAGMNARFQLTPQAMDDLDTIWSFIAEDNREAAGRVEGGHRPRQRSSTFDEHLRLLQRPSRLPSGNANSGSRRWGRPSRRFRSEHRRIGIPLSWLSYCRRPAAERRPIRGMNAPTCRWYSRYSSP